MATFKKHKITVIQNLAAIQTAGFDSVLNRGRFNSLLLKKKYLWVDIAEQVISNNVEAIQNEAAAGWGRKETERNQHC